MATPWQMRRGGAFTLVELLVVIGIIAVLIAILLPVLNRVQQQARQLKCAANLHSLGQALVGYTTEYRYYPGTMAKVPWSGSAPACAVWPVRLRKFTGGNQEVFYCPAQDESCRWPKGQAPAGGPKAFATEGHARYGYEPGEPVLDAGKTYFSYGYNSWGSEGGPGDLNDRTHKGLGELVNVESRSFAHAYRAELPAARVRRTAQMIAIGDTVADGWSDFIISPSTDMNGNLSRQPGKIHRGGANFLFCDGHVQWYAQEAITDFHQPIKNMANLPNRRLWNNDHSIGEGSSPG